MKELVLIGIGTGNPEHLTLQAIRAMRACDLVLVPRKGEEKAELAELRDELCATHGAETTRIVHFDMPVRDPAIQPYRARVDAWHDAIAARWLGAIDAGDGPAERVGLLVWGDPSLYDSTMRITERLAARRDFRLTVIPGITALQGLTAAHAIPINEIGAAFTVTTGRQLRDHGFPADVDTVAVMLDGECSFQTLDPEGLQIWWGAYVGMEQEIIDAGPLAEAGPRIVEARAAARAKHGWIMDIYILRRQPRTEA
ncbi:MAG: precorrin-6A synthase (deacetylating) [Hyphomicrobiales bacterium]|nr:MAG: precorrin-6A synthase (deacetylating) [Hyphomicrobiales bacterium]